MKTAIAAIALVLSSLAAGAGAQAQERQVTVYSGPVAIELPSSLLRGTTGSAAPMHEATPARKVRVVLQSPYGN